MSDTPTVLSAAHKEVIKLLENWGIELIEEVDFPPYRVDCFLPNVHVAIEVDGPHHSKKADEKRNKKLLEDYFLPTFRINVKDVRKSERWSREFWAFLEEHIKTADSRKEKCQPRTPWL